MQGRSLSIDDISVLHIEDEQAMANFRTLANATPALLWMTTPTGENCFINKPLADFLGVPEHATLPQGAYAMHPADADRAREKFADCLARRADHTDEHRLRRADGQYCWVLAKASPRFSPSGEFLGYAGIIIDISNRKRAEVELRTTYDWLARELNERIKAEQEIRDLGQRLIYAQEEERARIARELHDDLGQQIGALSVALSNLKAQIVAQRPDADLEADRLHTQISQVASSVRQLSHELHPAILDHAGIAVALRSYCRDYSLLSGVNVSFHASGTFDDVSPAAALCLYRVVQEALQNVAKHAKTNAADVHLVRAIGNLRLTVSDHGVGCDLDRARASDGLGLVSMKERVGLVKGTLTVESKPGAGTTLWANVPAA